MSLRQHFVGEPLHQPLRRIKHAMLVSRCSSSWSSILFLVSRCISREFQPRADFERFVQARIDSGVETLKALGLDWAS